MTVNESAAAWDAVHEALPARWAVGPVTYDPGVVRPDGLMGAFSVTARGPHHGRGKAPVTVSGTGEDEAAALRDLDDRLRGVPKPDETRLDELRRRLRFAYVEGPRRGRVAVLRLGRRSGKGRIAAIIACLDATTTGGPPLRPAGMPDCPPAAHAPVQGKGGVPGEPTASHTPSSTEVSPRKYWSN
jgi:hypothetical protein